jgi:hypothetical protein
MLFCDFFTIIMHFSELPFLLTPSVMCLPSQHVNDNHDSGTLIEFECFY